MTEINQWPKASTLGEQSRLDAESYNSKHGAERYRIVVTMTDGKRFVGEDTYERITPALERVVEIERTMGIAAFVVTETFKAMR